VAKIHEEVRQDLREDDIRKEARTIRRDVLGPLTRLRFGEQVPVPHFRRKLPGPEDVESLGKVLSLAVNDLGLSVSRRWAHQALGVPEAAAGEATLEAAPTARPRE
jgi:phage gp29-like protein